MKLERNELRSPLDFSSLVEVHHHHHHLSPPLSTTCLPPLRYSAAKCFRGRRFGDIELEWFVNFLDAHRDFPQDNLFTWIWHSDWSHDILNGVKMADEPVRKLLQRMKVRLIHKLPNPKL